MKLDMELKPGDVVLLKVLACVVIIFFSFRFFVIPGIEKHQELTQTKEELTQTKEEMEYAIENQSVTEKKAAKQQQVLTESSKGFYQLLENQEVDELVTGLALKQGLKPVYLKIENTTPGIPAAYQTVANNTDEGSSSSSAQSSADQALAEADGTDTGKSSSGSSGLNYVNITTVSITLQGTEQQIRAMLDDIAKNYPGVQVRSFNMNETTYVDSSLQQVSQNNCECVLAVYTCGQLGK